MAKKGENQNIDSLVELAQKGDTHAFGLLYDEMVKPVYRYIYYRVDPQIAEDLTEETFLKVWQNLKKYKKGPQPFSAWIFRIAHNLVCDHYRQHRETSEIDESLPNTSDAYDPHFQVNVKFNQVRLRKAILQLPPDYQQVIVLKYINELDNTSISLTIGKPEGTVRTIQFRALQKLRVILENKREDF